MRKISAHYVFTVDTPPLPYGIVTVDNEGGIVSVEANPERKEYPGVEFYSGVLTPGFVNCHCHIELSHLEGILPQGIGLSNFVGQISTIRNIDQLAIEKAIRKADRRMQQNGIVAVGDIVNTTHSLGIKAASKIYYRQFVELFSSNPERASSIFENGKKLLELCKQMGDASIVPHAAYSVSDTLMQYIVEVYSQHPDDVISIHNQECEGEDLMISQKRGALFEALCQLGVNYDHFSPKEQSALMNSLERLESPEHLLLVHNTFTSEKDVQTALKMVENIFWVLCPKSNLFLEKRLPDTEMFRKNNCVVCLGTDSLASNTGLSILDEMYCLQKHKDVDFESLLQWATINGARALKQDAKLGTLTPGKKPGLNLLTAFNFKDMQLSESSKVKSLI